MARILLGKGTTNAQGIATMTEDAEGNPISGYTGVGAGEVDVQAEVNIDGSAFVSDTYTVLDCIFRDRGTSTDFTAWTTTDFTDDKINRGDDYTTLIPADTWDSHNETISNDEICIEFDINMTFSSNHSFIRFYGESSSLITFNPNELGLITATWHHVKIVRSGNTFIPTVDNVAKTGKSVSASVDTFRFVLSSDAITDLKYKNFIIYPV